jgi:hypothetical protein
MDAEGTTFHSFNNPAALAVSAICAANLRTWPLLDSFLDAGGIPAAVRLFGDSSCLVTLHTASLIESMLNSQILPLAKAANPSEVVGVRPGEIVDSLFQAGKPRVSHDHLHLKDRT